MFVRRRFRENIVGSELSERRRTHTLFEYPPGKSLEAKLLKELSSSCLLCALVDGVHRPLQATRKGSGHPPYLVGGVNIRNSYYRRVGDRGT